MSHCCKQYPEHTIQKKSVQFNKSEVFRYLIESLNEKNIFFSSCFSRFGSVLNGGGNKGNFMIFWLFSTTIQIATTYLKRHYADLTKIQKSKPFFQGLLLNGSKLIYEFFRYYFNLYTFELENKFSPM